MCQSASKGVFSAASSNDDKAWFRRSCLLAAALVLASILIAMGAGILVRDLHHRAIDDTQRNLSSLSAVLTDQADRALQAIELVQDTIVAEKDANVIVDEAEFITHFSTAGIHEQLKARIAALPQINAVTIISDTGKLLNFSRYWPIPDVNISDRDYFKVLSAEGAPNSFLSRPVMNRGDGTWTLYLARRVSAPDGRFLGLVLGAVELAYFEQLYAAVAPAPDFVFSMFRSDGVLLARYPNRPGTIGEIFPTAGAQIVSQSGASRGVTRVIGPIDGRDRLVSTAGLPHFPVRFSVSRTVEASLASWKQQAFLLSITSLMLVVAVVVAAWFGLRQLRGHRALLRAEAARGAAEERARGEQLLRQDYARFGVAVDNMTQGLWMFDEGWRLIVANARMADIAGLAAPLPIGSGLAGAARHLAAAGLLPPARARAGLRRDVAAGRPAHATWAVGDGRTLTLRIKPVPVGGWLLTYDDVTEQLQAEARANFLAHHDALTLLPNRALFGAALDQAIAGAAGSPAGSPTGGPAAGASFAVMCLDVARFKEVNDNHGHAVGDLVLREVAARLQRCLREVDTVARLGGDEFAIILAGPADRDAAQATAAALLEELALPCVLDNRPVCIAASVGIAIAPVDGLETDLLLRRADVALYDAKTHGPGQFRFFDPVMDRAIRFRRQTELELSHAIERNELELHYQPLVRLATREIVGFEALLRWRHPERGLVSPCDFIPLAEETGLIVAMGDWVLATACAEAARWDKPLLVAVNLSPVQFRERHLVASVVAALASSGLAPARLELEITESMLLHDTEDTLGVLRRLHALGITIALDDFGTGYSSLSYLRRFPFDKVKIDQSFVHDLVTAQESRVVVRAITYLCAELGMKTLAEGVETEAQLALLAAERCLDGQGYLFSRPVPAAELPRLLAGSRAPAIA